MGRSKVLSRSEARRHEGKLERERQAKAQDKSKADTRAQDNHKAKR